MKANVKAIAKAAVILIFLTILPLFSQQLMPREFFNLLSMQGFDIVGLLNKIGLIGLVFAIMVLMRGHVEKPSNTYLALSTAWKFLWLFVVFFALSLGHPETLGLATLSSGGGSAENSVTFDFRLFTSLATVIVAVMVVKSVIEFRETKPKVAAQEPEKMPDQADPPRT